MRLVLLSAALVLFASPASAAFTIMDDPVFGTGAVTFDTLTGLAWLDVDKTVNMSYADAEALPDWTHADVLTIQEFWLHGDVIGSLYGDPSAEFENRLEFINMVGITQPGSFNQFTIGYSSSPASSPGRLLTPWIRANELQYLASLSDSFTSGSGGPSSQTGHWLLNASQAVPEPSSLAFVSLAVASLFVRRRPT